MTRRSFVGTALAVGTLRAANNGDSRLAASPNTGAPASATPGLRPLGLRQDRDALLYIPESSNQSEKAPLVISLHGATRDADRGITLLRSLADQHGFLLLAPASEEQTWDGIQGFYGEDVKFINRSIARTFEIRRIDPARMAIAGFSDGASYSLSLGLANGDLFSAVLGFSSGFIIPGERIGKPPVFMSHGTIDPILPIELCSRRIVPVLRDQGYRVTYQEFEGKHTLPPEIAAASMRWFMAGPAMAGNENPTPAK